MWAVVGLLFTIGGTFLEVSLPNAPWFWFSDGLRAEPLGITYQVGAVLTIGCLGGCNAAVLSQIAYLVLGLLGFQVFAQGGGLDYLSEPTFGYLLGFVPGAWVCGFLAFRRSSNLELLTFSCLCGLLTIHLAGLVYLGLLFVVRSQAQNFLSGLVQYSLQPLPGQLIVICAVVVLSLTFRRLMFS
ncbi:biotin transporter BioY [Leptolyngbya sp. FACHB-261]|nr:biotin transporter BioY [Leptolyngbya sp. FACHB-261]